MNRAITAVNVVEVPFGDYPGGVARFADDLCRRQLQWGYRVYLVGKKFHDGLPDREVIDGITVFRLESKYFPPPDPRNLMGRISNTRRAMVKILAETGGIDVLHTHTPLHGISAMKAVGKSPASKIHSIHSPWLMEMEAQKVWEGGRPEEPDQGLPGSSRGATHRGVLLAIG